MNRRQRSYTFPADTSVLEQIGQITSEAGRAAGFVEIDLSDIQLAVGEACTNTIIHGLKSDPARYFQLIVHWKIGEVEFVIQETGEPFDPMELSDPDLDASLEERRAGGLGLYFLRKLMDEADFRISENGVKTWRMVKRRIESDHSNRQ